MSRSVEAMNANKDVHSGNAMPMHATNTSKWKDIHEVVLALMGHNTNELLPPREAPELQCCLAVGTSLLSGSLNCRPAKRSLQIYGSTREGAQIYGSTAKTPRSTDLP
nr:hypothetical protein Iba_chr10dCG14340 [Ipomoea batatas]